MNLHRLFRNDGFEDIAGGPVQDAPAPSATSDMPSGGTAPTRDEPSEEAQSIPLGTIDISGEDDTPTPADDQPVDDIQTDETEDTATPTGEAQLSEDDMDVLLSVHSKARVDAAIKKGPQYVKALLDLARDEIASVQPEDAGKQDSAGTGPKSDAKPEPKPDQKAKTEQPASPAGAFEIDTAAMDELKDVVGDTAYSKVLEPMVKQVASMRSAVAEIVTMIQAMARHGEQSSFDSLVDGLKDAAMYGDDSTDRTDAHAANRAALYAQASEIMRRNHANGGKMTPKRAVQLAHEARSKVSAAEKAKAEIKDQMIRRSKSVGGVMGGVRPSAPALTGTQAAIAAVRARKAQLGIS